ncbi:glycosyltransferase family 4 protein [Planctomycetota bacterium]
MKSNPPFKVAIITAGAAGMYCGSCMRDNTLAKAMCMLGVDARLIPTYTPIRTDEEDVSVDQVFFGGINIFLQEKVPLFRFVPKLFDRMLDRPGLIRWATKRASNADPKKLGGLTISMLQGSAGHQGKEVTRLSEWLSGSFQPDAINFSNALIAGCIPDLRRKISAPVFVTLQGDDIFLDELTEGDRSKAIAEIKRLDQFIDGYIVFSEFYADYMSEYFGIGRNKFVITPLGINIDGFADAAPDSETAPADDTVTIGYMARIAPEKGFHLLIDAFIRLHAHHGMEHVRLATAGWLGDHRKEYFDQQLQKLEHKGLAKFHRHHGELDRLQKIRFLCDADIVSVPTTYRDPKGIFVLESLACGTPVVQPNHGAFPELLDSTEGGLLFDAHSPESLASQMARLIGDADQRCHFGEVGQRNVRAKHTAEAMAEATIAVLRPPEC